MRLFVPFTASAVWTEASRTLTNPSGVWSDATRVLTAFAAQDLFIYPAKDTGYNSGLAASSATADAFGAWVQLVADVGVGRVLMGLVIKPAPGAAENLRAEVEIGEGGAGSEARIDSVAFPYSVAGQVAPFYVPFLRSLTNNARLTARVRNQEAVAQNFNVATQLVG